MTRPLSLGLHGAALRRFPLSRTDKDAPAWLSHGWEPWHAQSGRKGRKDCVLSEARPRHRPPGHPYGQPPTCHWERTYVRWRPPQPPAWSIGRRVLLVTGHAVPVVELGTGAPLEVLKA